MAAGGPSLFIHALKSALFYHWNLLYLGAAAAVGVICGRPDIVYPLAAAVEILYLAALASNRRYQAAVEARRRPGSRSMDEAAPQDTQITTLMRGLSGEDRARFELLRRRIQALQPLPEGFSESAASGPAVVNDRQMDNINRLLWIYLKLLHTKAGMETFFRTTDETEIRNGLHSVQERLNALGPENEDDDQEVKLRHSLIDMRQTLESRLHNYHKARENYDFLKLELERLNAKIAGIIEMGIHRQDGTLISTEIDIVAASVLQTEKTMQELASIAGLTMAEEKPPALLKRRRPRVETIGSNNR